MRLCFHHQPFDVDVSSGTDHARHQWHELGMGYELEGLAVINETDDPYLSVNDSMPVQQYPSLDAFLAEYLKRDGVVFLEAGDFTPCHRYNFKRTQWIVIGGTGGLPERIKGVDYVTTCARNVLYPRQAAAIALDYAWQALR